MSQRTTRRDFLKKLAIASSAVVLVPTVSACKSGKEETTPDATPTDTTGTDTTPESQPAKPTEPQAMLEVPQTMPEGWDPVDYNRTRGNQGAIPESYLDDINGPAGTEKHLGKHLPYVPAKVDASLVPAGFLALMWGDPEKGYAKHPNAPRNDSNNNEGHWYNWIKVRKAVEGEAEELQSSYTEWPGTSGDENKYAVMGGGDITEDGGKNTIYLAAIPTDVKPGDTIRIHAHCLTHGEYVDFMTIPA